MTANRTLWLKQRLRQGLSPQQYQQLKSWANCFFPRVRHVTVIPDVPFSDSLVRYSLEDALQNEGDVGQQPTIVSSRTDIEAIQQQIAQASWYHSYELLPGLTTPGIFPIDPGYILDVHRIPRDLTGKKALDIGTWDGPLAFELERRGAISTALDIQNPDCTGFNIAKAILRSNVSYVQASVYDSSQLFSVKFDIICFFGVFYHLKYPLLAFEEIAKVLADDGFLIFEGECLRNYAETLKGQPIRGSYWWQFWKRWGNKRVREIDAIANSDFPLTLSYPGRYQGTSNWFIPNLACIFSWLEASGLEILSYCLDENLERKPFPTQRISAVARKSRRSSPKEHPVVSQNWRKSVIS